MLFGAASTPSSEAVNQSLPDARTSATAELLAFTTRAASCVGEISAREMAKPRASGSPVVAAPGMPLIGRKALAPRSKTKPNRGPLRFVAVLLPPNTKPTEKTAANVRTNKLDVMSIAFSG
jgi:hypothetical protein